MSGAELQFVHHCEECGYELTGLGDVHGAGRCPECSRPFHRLSPFVIGPPINWMQTLVQTTTPAAIGSILIAVTARLMSHWTAAALLLPTVFLLWIGLAIGVPAGIAHDLAEHRWVRPKRSLRAAPIALGAIAVNIFVLIAIVLLANLF